MAWLNATPKPPEGSRRAELAAKDKTPQPTRIETMRRNGVTPAMPPNPLPHLVSWLIEIGLSEAAGMGVVPISWRELEAWQRNTFIRLSPWEARMLKRLSTEYLAEGRRAESENCPPPWRAKVTQAARDNEVARLRMVLG